MRRQASKRLWCAQGYLASVQATREKTSGPGLSYSPDEKVRLVEIWYRERGTHPCLQACPRAKLSYTLVKFPSQPLALFAEQGLPCWPPVTGAFEGAGCRRWGCIPSQWFFRAEGKQVPAMRDDDWRNWVKGELDNCLQTLGELS